MNLLLSRDLGDLRSFLGKITALSAVATLVLGFAILSVPATADAASIVVNPGESIQAAIDSAAPGTAIIVKPGTYMETHGGAAALRITQDNIKLIAKSNFKKDIRVTLIPGPGNEDGILAKPADGQPDIQKFLVKGFTVQGFPDNGIKTDHVNKFKIIRNESIDNLENGIQPLLSANGLVKQNLSYGSDDSALWVEGSENVRVLKNIVHSSPTGIEVTVSKDVQVKKNEVYNNSVGIGLYHPSGASVPPPGFPLENWRIEKNHIYDNNRPNSAPPGSQAAGLPPGGGILVLGVDRTLVRKNLVEDNDFYGIATVDYCLAVEGTAFNCTDNPPAVEDRAQLNEVIKNTFINNGTAPDPGHPLAAFAADMTYIVLPGPPPLNCYDRNEYTTYEELSGGLPPQC